MKHARLLPSALVVSVLAPIAGLAAPAAAAPTWREQVNATPGYSHATDAAIAVDGTGRVTVATQAYAYENDVSSDRVVVASRDVGDPVFDPEQTLAADNAWSPDVATNSDGLTVVVFEDDTEGSVAKVAVRLPGEQTFAIPVPVSSEDVEAYSPQAVVGEDGAITVAFEVYDPVAFTGYAQVVTRAAGATTWSEPVELLEPLLLGVDDLALGVDDDGLVTAAWTAADHVYAVTADPATGAWPDAQDLTPSGAATEARLAVGRDGTVAVGWRSGTYPELTPWLAVRGPGDTFDAGPLEAEPSDDYSEVVPAVAPDGEVTAAWMYAGGVRVGGSPGGEAETIAAADAWVDPVIGVSDDVAVVVWQQSATEGYTYLAGSHRVDGGAWSEVEEVTPDVAGADEEDPVVAIDPRGDATVAFREYDDTQPSDNSEFTGTVTLDSAGPRLAWTASGPGTAGVAVSLAVSARDWSGPVTASWTFGDGGTGTGLETTHTYAAAGTYPVTVTATDGVGNVTTSSGQVTIAPAPTSPPAPTDPPAPSDTTAPVLSGARLDPRRLPTGSGARLAVTSTENARLDGVVQRKRRGVWKTVGTKRWGIQAGANDERFYGRAAQRRLKDGRYRVRLVATDAAGNSSTVTTVRFRVQRTTS